MKLKVGLAQIDVKQSAPQQNLEKAREYIRRAAEKECGLICFPEMWTTGFNWENNKVLAGQHDEILNELSILAKEHRIWINGSMPLPAPNGGISNTAVLLNENGERVATYSKAHLFTLLHEEQHITAGDHLSVVDTPWGRLGLTICYDIRFPELFRTYALQGVQFILSPMAFPNPRLDHWKILVRARAVENQLYMIGVNQVGQEDFGCDGEVTYFGHSCVIGPWGETLTEANEAEETLLTAMIDTSEVDAIRSRMTVLEDRRPDLYRL